VITFGYSDALSHACPADGKQHSGPREAASGEVTYCGLSCQGCKHRYRGTLRWNGKYLFLVYTVSLLKMAGSAGNAVPVFKNIRYVKTIKYG
jgi:hypothetical protein